MLNLDLKVKIKNGSINDINKTLYGQPYSESESDTDFPPPLPPCTVKA